MTHDANSSDSAAAGAGGPDDAAGAGAPSGAGDGSGGNAQADPGGSGGTTGSTGGGTGTTTASPPPYQPPRRPVRSLRRSDNRVLGGVCAGVADFFDVDPVIVRVLTAVAALFASPIVVVGYLIAWALLPPEGSDRPERGAGIGVAVVIGAILLVPVALAFLAMTTAALFGVGIHGGFPGVDLGWLLGPPMLLLLLVLLVAGYRRGRYDGPPPPPPPPGPIEPPPPGVPAWWAQPQPERPWPTRREPATLSWLSLSAALLAVGAALSTNLLGATHLNVAALSALALGVVSAGLVVGAWVGSPRGLVPAALVLALATGIASVVVDFSGGDRYYRPSRLEDVRRDYRLGVGQITLDLRDIRSAPIHPVRVRVTAGRVVVVVPSSLHTIANAHVSNGRLDVFGVTYSGRRLHVVEQRGGPSDFVLELETSVRFGSVEVRSEAS